MKRLSLYAAVICILLLFGGCSVKRSSSDKIKDIEYTVVEKDKLPDELKAMIEEKKKEPFKITYADQGYLYVVQGYGGKETSGYSIKVTEVYEALNAIYIHTNLEGPSKDEKIVEKTTYPYVVLKMEMIDKNVAFK